MTIEFIRGDRRDLIHYRFLERDNFLRRRFRTGRDERFPKVVCDVERDRLLNVAWALSPQILI
jgi:hypothetical protein